MPDRLELSFIARISSWWLGRRGLVLLYRGQRQATARILSPLARVDPDGCKALIGRMRSVGLRDDEIAGYAARWDGHPVPPVAAPPGLAGEPLGAVGVTVSRIIGMAAHYAGGGVVHVIRLPASLALRPWGWPCLKMEAEHVVLDQLPPPSVAGSIAAGSLPSLKVNERDQVVLGS